MPTSVKRSVQIKITLSADLHARLHQIAQQVGQAPATLVSVWVGEKVRSLEAQAGMVLQTVQAMAPMLERQFGEQLKLADAVVDPPKPDPFTRSAKKRGKS